MTASIWANKVNAGVNLKPRDPNDFYPTPLTHVRAALAPYAALNPIWVLDIGAGAGVWGEGARKLWPDTQIIGIEKRANVLRNPAYDRLYHADFLSMPANRPAFDLIMANPPYALSEKIIRKAFSLLMPSGVMVMLFRLQFLASIQRYPFWREDFPPTEIIVCSDRPSFSGNGKTDSDDYMLVHWQKGYTGRTFIDWVVSDDTKRAKLEQPKQKALF